MTNEKVFAISFAKVYPMLIAKAKRNGRSRDEVLAVTAWLTGYSREQLEELMVLDITYGDFFRNAPALNPARKRIKGSVCGVKVESIEDPLMQEIRYLDKLVDELAKGKPMEKIMRLQLCGPAQSAEEPSAEPNKAITAEKPRRPSKNISRGSRKMCSPFCGSFRKPSMR